MAATLDQVETLIKAVHDRLEAAPVALTEEQIKAIVNGVLEAKLAEDSEFMRKVRYGNKSEADARLIGSKFSRYGLTQADIELAYDVTLAAQRVGLSPGPSPDLENAFKAVSKAYYIDEAEIKRQDRAALDNMWPRVPKAAFYGRDRWLAERGRYEETDAYQRAVKAMDTAESGFGSQLIGAQYVGDLWDGARPDSRVFGLLETFEMSAPTAYLPVPAGLPEMTFVAEATSPSQSNLTTVKTGSNRVQVDAKKFVIPQVWSTEMEEDSIIPFVAFIRRQAGISLAKYSDSVVLNGDTTNAATGNINLDDADPADTKHYLAFDGIRHAALVDNTGNATDIAGALAYIDLMNASALMVDTTYSMDWGMPTAADDLVYVADPFTARKIAQMDEVLTVDKFGSAATILTGQVGRIGMHPLVSSIDVSRTEADGKVSTTGGNNIKGQVVVFNRRGYVVGWRRRIRVEVERLTRTDQTHILFSLRLGLGRFSPTGAAAGIEHSAVLYDISL